MRKWIHALERSGGALLCILVAITPWLYATTEKWSMNILNIGSYTAGLIFVASAILARVSEIDQEPRQRADRLPRLLFLGLNILTLAFCAVAWWNARGTFSAGGQSFTYHEYIKWLPTTYDSSLTRDTLLMLLACATAFWSIRYWLRRGWERMQRARDHLDANSAVLNPRFSLLLWVLSLNGMLLAIQGILQRLSGSPKLLWMRTSYWADSDSCFGPFSYRGNAADYLNLLWPVALAFWWYLSRERRRVHTSTRLFTDGPELMLLPAVVIMAAATFVTLSRGGVAIATGLMLCVIVLFAAQKGVTRARRIGMAALLSSILLVVTFLGWGGLIKRFKAIDLADLSGRTEIYAHARQMAADYPWFGTGPGSFRSVHLLYREDSTQTRHGYVHDDWLELRVTFGWVGFALVLAQLVLLAIWVVAPGKPAVPGLVSICFFLALAGCLAHAKYDLPFQTYSIVYTFVALCAIMTTMTPSRR